MPINTPNLDDRCYDQLYSEAMGVIARYFPQYADLGPVDPAMALVELFCYYFDITSYQINQITPEARRNFAALIGIAPENDRPEEAIRKALAELSAVKRAIAAEDIAVIIKRESMVARVCVLPGERLLVHVVAPQGAANDAAEARRIYRLLRGCGPLGARYAVRYAPVLSFDVSATIIKQRDTTVKDNILIGEVESKLRGFFDPLTGGETGEGWEFGRAVSRGEIYGLIEGVAGVDHASSLFIRRTGGAYRADTDELPPEEGGLVTLKDIAITIR